MLQLARRRANIVRGKNKGNELLLVPATRPSHNGRSPHLGPLLARGQLVRVTQEHWVSPWSYFLMAPPAHFKRPVVRTFVDWALEEARSGNP